MNAILVLNAGSSSLKASVFEAVADLPLLASGRITRIGAQAVFSWNGNPVAEFPTTVDHGGALRELLTWTERSANDWHLQAVGHRIVHGGEVFSSPTMLTPQVLHQLETLIPLAPLHQPTCLAAVYAIAQSHPDLMQIGCFDTAFHKYHAPVFQHYALPKYLRDQGIRRYGFHGLSYEWVAHELVRKHPQIAPGRIVAAHLGNGASLCAMLAGKSVDTTMGMTALDGLPMGTRCGCIDPGVVLYMLRVLNLKAERVEQILSCESGLVGLSGVSHDVQNLLESGSTEANFAIQFFCTMAAQHIARMAVSIGGLDALVFTGGIGEHAASIRTQIKEMLSFLVPFEVLVISANEERMIAEHCWTLSTQQVRP
ncbi:acetate/propionate family kinase [Bythopirellula polymerisocia]|nr:acetate/propionate family kinase [Bythopirellula polymerisocia]